MSCEEIVSVNGDLSFGLQGRTWINLIYNNNSAADVERFFAINNGLKLCE